MKYRWLIQLEDFSTFGTNDREAVQKIEDSGDDSISIIDTEEGTMSTPGYPVSVNIDEWYEEDHNEDEGDDDSES